MHNREFTDSDATSYTRAGFAGAKHTASIKTVLGEPVPPGVWIQNGKVRSPHKTGDFRSCPVEGNRSISRAG